MEIKPAVFKKEMREVSVRVSDVVYGCDFCKKEIDFDAEGQQYLEIAVFQNNSGPSERKQFCSWVCVIKGLRKVKSDYFVSLPFLQYDAKKKGIRAKDFLALFKKD